MTGFFDKIFGKKKEEKEGIEEVIHSILKALLEHANFDLNFDLESVKGENEFTDVTINFSGNETDMLMAKEGLLLDAIQLYVKRVVQHQAPTEKVNIQLDCDGFRERANQALIDLAEKLKGIALNKGKPVYFRALPPKDRRIIHQYLANDEQVKSRSVGDGLYKKIKIYPIRNGDGGGAKAVRNA